MLLLDGHTHLHDHVQPDVFLQATYVNLHRLSESINAVRKFQAVLCLADFSGAEGFVRLQSAATDGKLKNWRVLETGEGHSLGFVNASGDKLWVVAGRQLITDEKIEVMALGTAQPLPDSLLLFDTIDAIRANAALPILPWGVGKWWGKRGELVKSALATYGSEIILGDNGGRPRCWRPRLLARARKNGIPVVPGSDPLRVKSDCLRSGCFGLLLDEQIDERYPAVWIQKKIFERANTSSVIGSPLGLLPFINRQLALRTGC